MKLVKIFGGLVIMILVLFFLMRNTNMVSVDLVFAQYENVQVAVVMLGALALGMMIGYGVAVTNILTGKSELRSLRTKNKRLSDELNDLRNVAIDEGIYDSEDGVD
ncbi:MAG: LapA family protein [Candidatus Marinimicrobia bacterium]|nr:LapA family protein [Candidatus Neomarinimicrobiota bacterium]